MNEKINDKDTALGLAVSPGIRKSDFREGQENKLRSCCVTYIFCPAVNT